jgi:hypothetical protein
MIDAQSVNGTKKTTLIIANEYICVWEREHRLAGKDNFPLKAGYTQPAVNKWLVGTINVTGN